MTSNSGLRRGGLILAAGLLTAVLAPASPAARHHRRHASSGGGGGSVERSLAGVRIGDSFRSVLHRFGSPSETQYEKILFVAGSGGGQGGSGAVATKIFVGPSSPAPNSNGGGSGSGGSGGFGGARGGLGSGSLFQAPGEFGGTGAYPGGPGAYPGSPGAGAPAGPAAGTLQTPDHPEYRFIYDEPYSSSLEFTFSPQGRVNQIRATGYKGFVRTGRGIQLGVKFSNVLLAYGNPEKWDSQGPIQSVEYTTRDHIAFQFYKERLVGITVAQVE